jgi:hypothetical protein
VETVKQRLVAKYNISDGDYRLLESIIVRAIPHKAGHQWKFSGVSKGILELKIGSKYLKY